jgi:hypothetical protein
MFASTHLSFQQEYEQFVRALETKNKAYVDLTMKRFNEGIVAEDKYSQLPSVRYRDAVWWLVSGIATDFDLVGPKGCSKDLLQTALWDAARIAVYDDIDTRADICDWFRERDVDLGRQCSAPGSATTRPLPPLRVLTAGQTFLDIGCNEPDLTNRAPAK